MACGETLLEGYAMPFMPGSVGELRSQLGNGSRPVSRFELAKMVGVTEQTIKNWESGRGTPRVQHILTDLTRSASNDKYRLLNSLFE